MSQSRVQRQPKGILIITSPRELRQQATLLKEAAVNPSRIKIRKVAPIQKIQELKLPDVGPQILSPNNVSTLKGAWSSTFRSQRLHYASQHSLHTNSVTFKSSDGGLRLKLHHASVSSLPALDAAVKQRFADRANDFQHKLRSLRDERCNTTKKTRNCFDEDRVSPSQRHNLLQPITIRNYIQSSICSDQEKEAYFQESSVDLKASQMELFNSEIHPTQPSQMTRNHDDAQRLQSQRRNTKRTLGDRYRGERRQEPIPYTPQGIANVRVSTIKEFKLSEYDAAQVLGVSRHKYDYISQNKRDANHFIDICLGQQRLKARPNHKAHRVNLESGIFQSRASEASKISDTIMKLGKWTRFRECKTLVLEQYIYQKRLQVCAVRLVQLIFLAGILGKLSERLGQLKRRRELQLQSAFMCVLIRGRWMKTVRKNGATAAIIQQKRLRHTLLVLGLMLDVTEEKRARRCLRRFFLLHAGTQRLLAQMSGLCLTVKFTQRWTRHKLKTRNSKVEVLMAYWDKMVAHLMRMRTQLQDKESLELVQQLIEVPLNIRRYALTHYILKCRRLHAIAFYQWRSMFPSKFRYSDVQLEELQEVALDCLYYEREEEQKHQLPLPQTAEKSILTSNFLERYKLKTETEQSFNINSFEEIGISDPFPLEQDLGTKFQRPAKKDGHYNLAKLAYHPSRYQQGLSVPCVYIPKKEVLLKLMRACVGVTHEDQLWFNQAAQESLDSQCDQVSSEEVAE